MVASTAYLEDFTAPIKKMNEKSKMEFTQIRIITIVFGLVFLIIGLFVGMKVSGSIVNSLINLSSVAESFSKGDIDVDINVRSGDEIGKLANAFRELKTAIKKLIGG